MNKFCHVIFFLFCFTLPFLGSAQRTQTVSQKIQSNRKNLIVAKDTTSKKYLPNNKLEVIYVDGNFKVDNYYEDEEGDQGTESESDILYASFDTSAIHYPKYDFSEKLDTTTLVLVNKRKTAFVQPYRGVLTSHFAPRKKRFHYGVDIGLQTGDSVLAAFNGVVRIAKMNRTYGNLVVVRHDNGLETFYAHLSALEVTPGQKVTAGDLVGLGGNTGRSYGSHLHFEVRYLGAAIDPERVIDFRRGTLLADTLRLTKDYFQHQADNKTQMLASTSKSNVKGKAQPSSKLYAVRKGDNLGAIAKRNGTTVKALCQLNRIKENKTLSIGTKIRVR